MQGMVFSFSRCRIASAKQAFQKSMEVYVFRLSLLVVVVFVVLGTSGFAQTLAYTEVSEWPRPAVSISNTPTAWNFGQVVAVATDTDGNVLVLHRGSNPIIAFDTNGDFVRSWGTGLFSHGKVAGVRVGEETETGSRYSAVYGPAGCHACGAHAIRVDPQGHIWVVDAPGHVVYKLASTGDVLMRLGTENVSGTGRDTFNLPTDVGFAPNGDVYVSDGYGNARVVKFSSDGSYLLEWGRRGTGPGEFGLPHGIAVDAGGRVYVVDRDNRRVQIFDSDGVFLDEWTNLTGVQTVFITNTQQVWTGGTLRSLTGATVAKLPNGAGGHGMSVSNDAIFVAQLSGRVQKFVPSR